MSRLGWGKKAITEGCINKWYKDKPIGKMVKALRDQHRLLAMEYGGGKHRDSVLVYERCRFMKALNLPEPDIEANPAKTYIELAEAVKIWEETKERHAISRSIIEARWHGKRWETIASKTERSRKALRLLRRTEEYEHQVWCDYGKAASIFCKHKQYNECIRHLQHFYGISKRLAKAVLGTDWKAPEQKATQLTWIL